LQTRQNPVAEVLNGMLKILSFYDTFGCLLSSRQVLAHRLYQLLSPGHKKDLSRLIAVIAKSTTRADKMNDFRPRTK
jgi:hypothetical protein